MSDFCFSYIGGLSNIVATKNIFSRKSRMVVNGPLTHMHYNVHVRTLPIGLSVAVLHSVGRPP